MLSRRATTRRWAVVGSLASRVCRARCGGRPLSWLWLAVGITVVWAAPAAAQQLAVLQKIPAALLPFTGGARPDKDGFVTYNRTGFKSPEFQRGAMHYMLRAIARGDAKGIDDAWRAIDAAFRYQTPEGGFSRKGAPHGGPSAAAMWLAELAQAVLVLRESALEPQYRERIAQLTPKIHVLARWLARPQYVALLQREDACAPNRLLFDALAFGLSGVLTNDDALKKLGREFVDLAVAQYRPCDGVFLEKGGADSSYQAVAAKNLLVWLMYFPDAKLAAIADRAVVWELGRVGPDGKVDVAGNTRTGLGQELWMGHTKGVNLSEVTLCLLYHHVHTGNPESLAAARRIAATRK